MKKTEEFENSIIDGNDVEIDYIDAKGLLKIEIEKSAYTISKLSNELGYGNYLYEILDHNNKKKYSRDCIISILICINTEIDTTQRILQGFGHSRLYVRIPRDKIIFEGICKGLDIWSIDTLLIDNGFESLFK